MATFQEAYEAAEASEGSGAEEAVEALTEGTDVVGQTAGEGTEVEAGDESPDFDLEQYGSHLVTIKVDGVDQKVPVSELRNGFMRQSSYTQKTQELAAERSRLAAAESLASAYERNPQETIRFLAQQNGLTFAEAKAAAEDATEQTEGWANEGYADPRVDALEQRIAQLDQREAKAELQADIQRLGNLYGEDFDSNEVIAQAIKLGTTDLEAVFKQMSFDKVFARKGAETELAQRTAADTAKRTSAKQDLASTVASGSSFNGAGSTASTPITSVSQAMEAAAAEHGWDF